MVEQLTSNEQVKCSNHLESLRRRFEEWFLTGLMRDTVKIRQEKGCYCDECGQQVIDKEQACTKCGLPLFEISNMAYIGNIAISSEEMIVPRAISALSNEKFDISDVALEKIAKVLKLQDGLLSRIPIFNSKTNKKF